MKRFVLSLMVFGGLTAGFAHDARPFVQHLRDGERFQLHGEVESSVYFPPRAEPTRRQRDFPRVEFVPWLLERNFEVREAGVERIAGRQAVKYDLTPRHQGASHWRVWIDAQWNVPLAIEERTPQGEVVRRAAYQSIQGAPRRRLRGAAPRVNDDTFRRAVGDALPGLKLPEAFEPVGYRVSELGTELMFSDGVNVVALVIAPRAVRAGPGIASRRVGRHHVWLVGNLPDTQLTPALAGVRDVHFEPLGAFVPQQDRSR